jgi:hypothetical protein
MAKKTALNARFFTHTRLGEPSKNNNLLLFDT